MTPDQEEKSQNNVDATEEKKQKYRARKYPISEQYKADSKKHPHAVF